MKFQSKCKCFYFSFYKFFKRWVCLENKPQQTSAWIILQINLWSSIIINDMQLLAVSQKPLHIKYRCQLVWPPQQRQQIYIDAGSYLSDWNFSLMLFLLVLIPTCIQVVYSSSHCLGVVTRFRIKFNCCCFCSETDFFKHLSALLLS